jgi:hypothetical protein
VGCDGKDARNCLGIVEFVLEVKEGGRSTGILRWEMTTAQSLPRRPIEVKPSLLMALNAYSSHINTKVAKVPTWYRRPSGEKMVICLS